MTRQEPESEKELENLLEESSMPLQDLLAKYAVSPSSDQSKGESCCIFFTLNDVTIFIENNGNIKKKSLLQVSPQL